MNINTFNLIMYSSSFSTKKELNLSSSFSKRVTKSKTSLDIESAWESSLGFLEGGLLMWAELGCKSLSFFLRCL